MTSFRVQLPESFDFSHQEEWPRWSRRFERFRQASGLTKEEEEAQINTLIYAMGDQADDILKSFKLTDAQAKKYDTVKSRFDEHFVVRRNIIFERAKFNRRVQEEGETVDLFITSLHALAKHCNYETLHEDMIRDQIVVGLRNARSESISHKDSRVNPASEQQRTNKKGTHQRADATAAEKLQDTADTIVQRKMRYVTSALRKDTTEPYADRLLKQLAW